MRGITHHAAGQDALDLGGEGPVAAITSAKWAERRLPDPHLRAELGIRPLPPLVLQAGQVAR